MVAVAHCADMPYPNSPTDMAVASALDKKNSIFSMEGIIAVFQKLNLNPCVCFLKLRWNLRSWGGPSNSLKIHCMNYLPGWSEMWTVGHKIPWLQLRPLVWKEKTGVVVMVGTPVFPISSNIELYRGCSQTAKNHTSIVICIVKIVNNTNNTNSDYWIQLNKATSGHIKNTAVFVVQHLQTPFNALWKQTVLLCSQPWIQGPDPVSNCNCKLIKHNAD